MSPVAWSWVKPSRQGWFVRRHRPAGSELDLHTSGGNMKRPVLKRLARSAALVTASLLAVSACGSDSKSLSTTAAPATTAAAQTTAATTASSATSASELPTTTVPSSVDIGTID